MHFMIPGIIALTTMNTSFSAVSTRINISKIHEKSFEFYLTSPVNMYLLTIGHVLAGAFRVMVLSALLIISLFLTIIWYITLELTLLLFLILFS